MRRSSSRLSRASSCASASVSAHSGSTRPCSRLQLEHDRGEVLSDLVVQLLGDPPPLGLLGEEHPPHAGPALLLEPLERGVERADHIGHLGVPPASSRRPGWSTSALRISAISRSQRSEAQAQQHRVRRQHEREPGQEHGQLARASPTALDADRGQHEQQDGDDQDRRVDREHPAVQPEVGRVEPRRACASRPGKTVVVPRLRAHWAGCESTCPPPPRGRRLGRTTHWRRCPPVRSSTVPMTRRVR